LFLRLIIKASKGLVRYSIKIEETKYSDVNCLVSEAVTRWISCQRFPDERVLHKSTSPETIESRLSSVVDSIIKNERNSAQNRKTSTLTYRDDDLKNIAEKTNESIDQQIDEAKFIDLVKVKEGPFVASVAHCILKRNMSSRREIASELGVADSKVRAAKRRLKIMLEPKYQSIIKDVVRISKNRGGQS